MVFEQTPVLENERVRLEPLAQRHAKDLADAVAVGDLWRTWYTHVPAPDAMSEEIDRRLELQRNRRMAPWAVVDGGSSRAVGMTTFCNLDPANRRLEIGSTWLGRSVQGSGVNAAAKLLLLTRAFEDLDCIAVEFRAHWHNHQSRNAIARLGAKQDGVLRKHTLFENGTVRDTVVFSITDDEWSTVRFGLQARLGFGSAPRHVSSPCPRDASPARSRVPINATDHWRWYGRTLELHTTADLAAFYGEMKLGQASSGDCTYCIHGVDDDPAASSRR